MTEMWARLETFLNVIPELRDDLRSGLLKEQWQTLETGNYAIDQKEKSWLWYGSAPKTHFLDTVKTLFAPRG
jgi:hypothetical protein